MLIDKLKDSHAVNIAELAQKIKDGETIVEELENTRTELEVSTLYAYLTWQKRLLIRFFFLLQNAKKSHEEQLKTLKEQQELAIEQVREQIKNEYERTLESTQGGTAVAVEKMKLKHSDELNELKSLHTQELQKLKNDRDEAIEKAKHDIQVLNIPFDNYYISNF